MKPKLLFLVYHQTVGTGYTFSHEFLAIQEEARQAGLDVHVATTEGEMEPGLRTLLEENVPATCFHVIENGGEALVELVTQFLQDGGTVLIHVHGVIQLRQLIPLKKAHPRRLKIVFEVHTYRNRNEWWRCVLYAIVVGWMLRKYTDYVSFPAPFAATHFFGYHRLFRENRAGIIPQGLVEWGPQRLAEPPTGEVDAALLETLADEKLFTFLYLAKFVVGKGHEWLVKAMAPILLEFPQVRLILAGADLGRMNATKQLADRLGVAGQVLFPGHLPRDRVPWLASHCNVGVVPAVSETFGRNYLEPFRAGLPLIGTRKGLAEWFLQDYITGIGFEHNDAIGVQKAARFMLAHPQEASQMGKTASEMARQLFTWERTAAAYLRLYEDLLERV